MKFMKLGTKEGGLAIEGSKRTVSSHVPADFIVKVNSSTYFLHKHIMLPRCGLLQTLHAAAAAAADDMKTSSIKIHGIPGGETSFNTCVMYCYGMQISIGAYNFAPVYATAKFLQMSRSVETGNLAIKMEAFFKSCILEGWKDSILTLKASREVPQWAETLGITRRCIDSIVEKILISPEKVSWPFTYTRPGYERTEHQRAPKDWWTEDVSDLDIDTFRCLLTAVKLADTVPLRLIGEALHVYASRWLLLGSSSEILEKIVGMIPPDAGSVSVGFLMRLLRTAGASASTRAELVRRTGQQLQDASVNDLLLLHAADDLNTVVEVLESCVRIYRRRLSSGKDRAALSASIQKVAKLIDAYLHAVAKDALLPLDKFAALSLSLPEAARPSHDDLYAAIDCYLKDHPNMSKAEKKRMCSLLDCRKLSAEVCSHAVRNERLPLRTVVQVLFFAKGVLPDRGDLVFASAGHTPTPGGHVHDAISW